MAANSRKTGVTSYENHKADWFGQNCSAPASHAPLNANKADDTVNARVFARVSCGCPDTGCHANPTFPSPPIQRIPHEKTIASSGFMPVFG